MFLKGLKLFLIIITISKWKVCFCPRFCIVSWPDSVVCNQSVSFNILYEFAQISNGQPKNETNFKKLVFSRSGIERIPSDPFQEITFDSIDIEYCLALTSFGSAAFEGVKKSLKRININNTPIDDAEIDINHNFYLAVNSLPNLESLNISLTNIYEHTLTDKNFALPQPHLGSIHFNGFNFSSIGNYSFSRLTNLEDLDFSLIYIIKKIARNAFNISGSGRVNIDLTNTGLTENSFEDGAFSRSSKELKINLSHNNIALIEEKTFGEFFLQNGSIDFNHNPLDCHQLNKFLWIIKRKSELKSKLLNPYCKSGELVYDINPNLQIIIIFISISGLFIFGLILTIFGFCMKRRKNRKILEKFVNYVNEQNGLIEQICLDMINIIGTGHYGVVYKAKYNPTDEGDSVDVAVKTVKRGCDHRYIEMCYKEGIRFLNLNHHRIIGLYGISHNSNLIPMIIYPYMKNGDLWAWLKNEQNIPTLKRLIQFSCQISEGMEYLTEKNFVHRDLAARNCLLDDNLEVKIGDFGLSRDMYSEQYYKSKNKDPLPLKWMSPESIEKGVYSTASDVWSFGVLFWEMLNRGSEPYPDVEQTAVIQHLRANQRLPKPQLCSDHLYNLLLKCWEMDRDLRPNFSTIKNTMKTVVSEILNDNYTFETIPTNTNTIAHNYIPYPIK